MTTRVSTMIRTTLLTTAALLALTLSASAADAPPQAQTQDTQTAFSQAIKSIKGWFGSDTPDQAVTSADTTTASDDTLQVPPPVGGPEAIEPAAGMDPDALQVPPPYYGPQSAADAKPRASSFDGNPSVAAFGGAPASTSDIAGIVPAAGDEAPLDTSKMDCDAILKAADHAEEGDVPDTALIEACEAPQQEAAQPGQAAAPSENMEPAQPAFESEPMPTPLPQTQPAAGEVTATEAVTPAPAAEKPVQPATLQ